MAVKKKAAKKKVAKKKAAARKPAAKKKPAARKKAVVKKKPARAKVTPARLAAAAPKVSPFDARIAIARDNLRQLVEQAASSAGAANEELLAQRISDHEEKIRALSRQRDAYLKGRR